MTKGGFEPPFFCAEESAIPSRLVRRRAFLSTAQGFLPTSRPKPSRASPPAGTAARRAGSAARRTGRGQRAPCGPGRCSAHRPEPLQAGEYAMERRILMHQGIKIRSFMRAPCRPSHPAFMAEVLKHRTGKEDKRQGSVISIQPKAEVSGVCYLCPPLENSFAASLKSSLKRSLTSDRLCTLFVLLRTGLIGSFGL